jgi:tetratricopeptide (TPR) repeat protein
VRWSWLLLEKVPLLALSGAVGVLAILAQQQVEGVISLTELPWSARIANSLVNYLRYLGKMFWPVDLAIFYPFDRSVLTPPVVGGSVLFLVVVTVLAVLGRRQRPALLVGWLWYLVTLLPVIGLMQVGRQALADRFSYVPLVGIFLALAYSVPDRWLVRPVGTGVRVGVAGVLLACALMTWFQLAHWKDDATIWHRALEVTRNNATAEQCWGWVLANTEHEEEAEPHLRRALGLSPHYPQALNNLGLLVLQRGQVDQALSLLNRGVEQEPGNAWIHNSLGLAQLRKGDLDGAAHSFRESLRLAPEGGYGCYNLAFTLAAQGDQEGAAQWYARGRQLDPTFAHWAGRRAATLLGKDDPKWRCLPEALLRAEQAVAGTNRQEADLLLTLSQVWFASGRPAEAVSTGQEALRAARDSGQTDLLPVIEQQIRQYQAAVEP